MKLNVLILAILSFSQIGFLHSQDADRRTSRENLEAQKVAFITSELELTPREAQEFWPLYNAYREELQKLRKRGKGYQNKPSNTKLELNDKELDALMKEEFAADRQKIDLDEKYYELYKTALPVSKVAALYVAERNFKRELLKKLKENRE